MKIVQFKNCSHELKVFNQLFIFFVSFGDSCFILKDSPALVFSTLPVPVSPPFLLSHDFNLCLVVTPALHCSHLCPAALLNRPYLPLTVFSHCSVMIVSLFYVSPWLFLLICLDCFVQGRKSLSVLFILYFYSVYFFVVQPLGHI